jgi:tetratricopeptide (TPR) repeat protein
LEGKAVNRHARRQAKKLGVAAGGSPRPINYDALKMSALLQLQSGRFADAERLYEKALAIEPSDPDVVHFLGLIAYWTRRYDLALTRLTKATQLAPGYAEAHNNLGILLLEMRKLDQAIQRFERAVSLKPDYAAAYANLGNAVRDVGRPGQAVELYRRAIHLNPNHKEAHYWLAAALLSQGDLAAVADVCSRCLQLDPLCQHALAYQSMALYGLRKKADAKRLTDFSAMIFKARLSTPAPFDDLESFNAALIADIRAHPTLIWEPFDRVTRGGAVTKDLLESPTATIAGLEQALRLTIDECKKSLPADPSHPFFGTSTEEYRLTLIASILKAGGCHPSHIHEGAWLSGVYYAGVPDIVSVSDEGHAGWLEFGTPDCDLPAGCEQQVAAVAPESGAVVMFPSYFFHHTIPYQDPCERVGIAFDVYRER